MTIPEALLALKLAVQEAGGTMSRLDISAPAFDRLVLDEAAVPWSCHATSFDLSVAGCSVHGVKIRRIPARKCEEPEPEPEAQVVA